MNAWEGQVLAIAVKELLEAVKALGQGRLRPQRPGGPLGGDPRSALRRSERHARRERCSRPTRRWRGKPSPDLFLAKSLLAAVQKRRLLDKRCRPKGHPAPSTSPPAKAGGEAG